MAMIQLMQGTPHGPLTYLQPGALANLLA